MDSGMEVLSSTSYLSKASWLVDESRSSTKWTRAENKMFENALAVYDEDTPDRWHKVAAVIPGKTVGDVIRQYEVLEDDVSNIEAGLVAIPGYNITTSPFTSPWINLNGYGGYNQPYSSGWKRRPSRPLEQERKKGVPWTEEEHKLFLMGLKKYGKGDWRNISRNFVLTRTPTQVASHAQKYFIRQLSGGKDKRRASIHDITTLTLDAQIPPPDNKRSDSLEQQAGSSAMRKPSSSPWNQENRGGTTAIAFNSLREGNLSISCYGVSSNASKFPEQSLRRGGNGIHEASADSQNTVFHTTLMEDF